jgi:hypothetical protein
MAIKRTPASRAKRSNDTRPVKPRSHLLSETCIATKGGGSMAVIALLLLCIFGLAGLIVLAIASPWLGGGGIVAFAVRFVMRRFWK